MAINDKNFIVVNCDGSTAWIYHGGAYTKLESLLPDSSGWSGLEAYGLSDTCRIVGTGYIRDDTGNVDQRAFEMIPEGNHCPGAL